MSLANGSRQNAQNKAYSCLKTDCFGKWKEFFTEKRKSILLTESIVVLQFECRDKMACFDLKGAELPKNFIAFI